MTQAAPEAGYSGSLQSCSENPQPLAEGFQKYRNTWSSFPVTPHKASLAPHRPHGLVAARPVGAVTTTQEEALSWGLRGFRSGVGLSVPQIPPRPLSLLHGLSLSGKVWHSGPGLLLQGSPNPGAPNGVGVRHPPSSWGEHISKHLCLDYGFWGVGEEAECCLGGPFPFWGPHAMRRWAGGG